MPPTSYHRVNGDDNIDAEILLERETLAKRALFRDCLIGFGGAILGAVLALILFRLKPPFDLDDRCSRYLSAYESPLLNDVGITFAKQTFEVASHKNQSVFQQAGGEGSKVDEAWEGLGFDYARVTLPSDVGKAAGLEGHVRVPGSEDYIGFVEVLHQVHCLNMVRQGLYFNYDFYRKQGHGPFASSSETLQYHLSHCVESIRQQLMCSADFNFFGYVQVENETGFEKLFPDYATQHVCRNYETIRDWAVDHQDKRLDDMNSLIEKLEVREGDIVLADTP